MDFPLKIKRILFILTYMSVSVSNINNINIMIFLNLVNKPNICLFIDWMICVVIVKIYFIDIIIILLLFYYYYLILELNYNKIYICHDFILNPCSLVLFTDSTQHSRWHSISEVIKISHRSTRSYQTSLYFISFIKMLYYINILTPFINKHSSSFAKYG